MKQVFSSYKIECRGVRYASDKKEATLPVLSTDERVQAIITVLRDDMVTVSCPFLLKERKGGKQFCTAAQTLDAQPLATTEFPHCAYQPHQPDIPAILLSELQLTNATHKLLTKNRIFNLQDVLRESPQELLKISGFGEGKLTEVRMQLWNLFGKKLRADSWEPPMETPSAP